MALTWGRAGLEKEWRGRRCNACGRRWLGVVAWRSAEWGRWARAVRASCWSWRRRRGGVVLAEEELRAVSEAELGCSGRGESELGAGAEARSS
jgi:hypothetical protein